ncbi:MAG: DUF192 domain-containing protein [Nitrososphaerales archaeon]|nr:DUF192 domain-containing protein [Nitrososphaerales archaeon]
MKLPRSPRALVSTALLILALALAAYAFLSVPGPANLSSVPTHFTVNGKTFPFTYLATNQSEREAGLMNRKITDTTTMLFVFPETGVYSFWMYGTNSSLDIVWLDVTGSVGRVVYLLAGAPTCSVTFGCPTYTPTATANYVIEARAGFAETNGVTLGTTVQLG